MCGLTGSIIGTAGALMSGVSAYQSAQASAKASDYQANIYGQNYAIAQSNAIMERQGGIDESRRIKLQTASNIASQKVAMAASGVDINDGSALDLMDSTKYYGEMDALTTYKNANSRALAYEAEAENYLTQSKMSSSIAENHRKTSLLSGLGNSLTGYGKISSHWYNYAKAGSWGNQNPGKCKA